MGLGILIIAYASLCIVILGLVFTVRVGIMALIYDVISSAYVNELPPLIKIAFFHWGIWTERQLIKYIGDRRDG